MKAKLIIRWLVLFILFIMALLATMPAKLMLYWFPVVGLDTSQASITGPWWHGKMRYGHIPYKQGAGITVTEINLRWQPQWRQLKFDHWHTQWQTPFISGHANLVWPLQDGKIQIQQAQMTIDLAHAPLPNLQVFGLYSVAGSVNVDIASMLINVPPSPVTNWQDWLSSITLPEPMVLQLSSLYAAIKNNYGGMTEAQFLTQGQGIISQQTTGTGLAMAITIAQPPTLVNGKITLEQGRLDSDMLIELTPETPNVLSQLLPLVAKHEGRNQYSVMGTWRL